MKILIPSYVFPNVKHIRTQIMNNIFSVLNNKSNSKIVWVIFQADKFTSKKIENTSLVDIHDFNDAVSLLKNIKPDCLFITSTPDNIQYSFSVAAKYLQIPIFSIYIYSESIIGIRDNRSIYESAKLMSRKFFSNKTSTDTMNQKQLLRRGRFYMYKNRFLINTLRKSKINIFKSLIFIIKDILENLSGKSKNYNHLADYHLLPDESWISHLIQIGIDKKNIFITGNPYWENLYKKFNSISSKKYNKDSINLLIVTDSLLEHGYWSEKQRTKFINNLITSLQKNPKIKFSIKIHPSSENKQSYIQLFKKLNYQVQIFQTELLTELLDNFDLIISYGSSTAHTEIIANNIKMVLFDLKLNLKDAPLVKEGIMCNLVTMCESFEELLVKIHECLKNEISISSDFTMECKKLFPADKKASEQIADILIKKINK